MSKAIALSLSERVRYALTADCSPIEKLHRQIEDVKQSRPPLLTLAQVLDRKLSAEDVHKINLDRIAQFQSWKPQEIARLETLIPEVEKTSEGFNVEDRATFVLGVFDSDEQSYLSHYTKKTGGEKDASGEVIENVFSLREVVRLGLKGWENFKDAQGQVVPFETETIKIPHVGDRVVASERSLKLLHKYYITELALKLISDNFLLGDDEKN